jgi:hypothetical protein
MELGMVLGQGLWLVGTWVVPYFLCSQHPARPQSQAQSDNSEPTSLPSFMTYASLSSDSHNYSMQEFALRYFRKSHTL